MSLWFYRSQDSTVKGPVSPSELLELIRKGVIQENTQVRKGDSPWVASTDISGLWEAAGRPSAAFDCPHCNKPISKPPIRCPHCNQFVQKATGRLQHHNSVTPNRDNRPSSTNDAHSDGNNRFGSRPGLYD